jgi:hypothetical protein
MRRPRVPAPVARALDLAVAMLVPLLALSALGSMWGWPGVVVGAPLMGLIWMFWPLPVPDDEGCLKCGHAHVHHQGTCQACLRDVVGGVPLSTAVPCDRFQRWSTRTRWDELRSTGVRP